MKSKLIFGNMINYIRNQQGLSMEEFGNLVGKNKSTISRWINGTRFPSIEEAEMLANKFDLPLEVLLFGAENSEDLFDIYIRLQDSRKAKVYNFAEHQLEEQNKVIHIHKDNGDYVTETLRGYLSAGTGELQLEEVLEDVEIPVEILPEQHYDMLLQINGDSMLPMFQDGERLFVRKIEDSSELRSGQIGVFIIDGESYLKKAYKEDNQLRLVSLNDKYDDLIFNEVNDIEVIGTVVM